MTCTPEAGPEGHQDPDSPSVARVKLHAKELKMPGLAGTFEGLSHG
jgi:hypothetical protein